MPHVVVVGAGIVGAATAYEVARRGSEVTVVERAVPGSGATGSSFGWIGRQGRWPSGSQQLRDLVLAHWRRWEREVPGVRVRWTGSLSWPPGHHEVENPPEDDVSSIDVELLAAGQVAALEPGLRRPPEHAVHVRSDGAVDAGAVTRALLAAAVRHGARLLTATEARLDVAPARGGGSHVVGVATAAGPIAADRVVVAAGAGTRAVCAAVGVDVPVSASPATLLRFRVPPGRVHTVLSCPQLEVREDGAGFLVAAAADGDSSPSHLDALGRVTAAGIRSTLRDVGPVELDSAVVGQRPMPADGAPIVGAVPGVSGLHVVVAHSGVCLAPVLGWWVAQEVVADLDAEALRGCRIDRPSLRGR